MSSVVRAELAPAALLGLLLACAGCDTDFSPGWEPQAEDPERPDAGQLPSPPPSEPGSPPPTDDAGQLDAEIPELPDTDAAAVRIPKFTCDTIQRCGQSGCQPLCLAPSMEVERCTPAEPCKAFGFSPVPCELCMVPPIK